MLRELLSIPTLRQRLRYMVPSLKTSRRAEVVIALFDRARVRISNLVQLD